MSSQNGFPVAKTLAGVAIVGLLFTLILAATDSIAFDKYSIGFMILCLIYLAVFHFYISKQDIN